MAHQLLFFLLLSAALATPSSSSSEDEYIVKKCQETRHPGLCVDMIRSKALGCVNAPCLALAAAAATAAYTSDIPQYIADVRSFSRKELFRGLDDCLVRYHSINAGLDAVRAKLIGTQYREAMVAVDGLVGLEAECQGNFPPGTSPMTQVNSDTEDKCMVVWDLAKIAQDESGQ